MNINNDLSILLYNARRAGYTPEQLAESLRARADAEETRIENPANGVPAGSVDQ